LENIKNNPEQKPMDRLETQPAVGPVVVLGSKRNWSTVPSGVVRLEGCTELYFNDPLGRSDAKCKTPLDVSMYTNVKKMNTPNLRASGAGPRLRSVEVPEGLQAELRDTATNQSDERALDSAVRAFVRCFQKEHALTKLYVATLFSWEEVHGGYEADIKFLLASPLGRRLVTSHTLQLNRGKARLTPEDVESNFERWATQVWTFDVPDSARQAILRVPPYKPNEIPPPVELALLANERIRGLFCGNPQFSAAQKRHWSGLDQHGRLMYSAEIANHLGINRAKITRALDGVNIIRTSSRPNQVIKYPPCIQQYINGAKPLLMASRLTISAILTRFNSADAERVLEAFAFNQTAQRINEIRITLKHDRQHGESFIPSCATCQDPTRQGFTCAHNQKNTVACAKEMGMKGPAENLNPADIMAGEKTTETRVEFKRRRLSSVVECVPTTKL
jgi:hypothetical protein